MYGRSPKEIKLTLSWQGTLKYTGNWDGQHTAYSLPLAVSTRRHRQTGRPRLSFFSVLQTPDHSLACSYLFSYNFRPMTENVGATAEKPKDDCWENRPSRLPGETGPQVLPTVYANHPGSGYGRDDDLIVPNGKRAPCTRTTK